MGLAIQMGSYHFVWRWECQRELVVVNNTCNKQYRRDGFVVFCTEQLIEVHNTSSGCYPHLPTSWAITWTTSGTVRAALTWVVGYIYIHDVPDRRCRPVYTCRIQYWRLVSQTWIFIHSASHRFTSTIMGILLTRRWTWSYVSILSIRHLYIIVCQYWHRLILTWFWTPHCASVLEEVMRVSGCPGRSRKTSKSGAQVASQKL